MSIVNASSRLRESLSAAIRRDEPMARHTSWRVGGPARLFLVCETLHDLNSALEILADEDVAWQVVGRGTNLLVSDAGFEGAVIVLGREFRRHSVDGDRITAGAGAMLAAIVQDAYASALSGLAFAVGIPGTVGGALAMNAGANEGWIGDVTESVTLLVPGAGLKRLRGNEVAWAYRDSGLSARGIIVEGVLACAQGDPRTIRAEMERHFRRRKQTQPLNRPSAGSVFVNPPGDHAARLIEAAGLKGARVGHAVVSGVHANFIVTEDGATADDVFSLIRHVQNSVREAYGIELRTEVRFLGSLGAPGEA
jgi:UDP-N-acetylmuramate dehydrogenase